MIFLHSSFRTASTYIWSRFRKAPRTVTYYEVFHEALDTLSPAGAALSKPDGWHSGHPAGAPYFLEYLPLLREGGGVEGFDPSMSYERYIPAGGCAGDISEAEAAYAGALVGHAEARGRIPVLTATRSLGRARGLKRALPGFHVLIYRNLFQQWCSFTDQAARGNPYFLDRVLDVVRLHQSGRVLQDLHGVFPVESASAGSANMFYTFVFLHLHLYACAAGAMDLILDVNRLAADPAYRGQVEGAIATQDIALDLSGARNSTAYSACQLGPPADFAEKLGVIGGLVADSAPDAAGRAFGAKVLAELAEEHDRHEFQAGALRSVLLGPAGMRAERDAALLECDRAMAEGRALLAGLEAARAGHAASVAERDQLALERTALRAECDAALAQCGSLGAVRDQLASERDGLRAERDAALATCAASEVKRDQLVAGRDAALAACAAFRAERDQLALERTALRAECDAALAHCAALGAVRDQLAAGRDAALAACAASGAERDQLALERTALRAECDAALARCAALGAARDQLASERDGLRAERDDALVACAASGAERDQLALERTALRAGCDAALARCGSLEAARDQLAAGCDAALAEGRALAARVAQLASERDDALARCVAAQAGHDRLGAERDGAAAACAAAEAERDRLAAECRQARAECEAAASRCAAAQAERDWLREAQAAVLAWAQADREAVLKSLSWRLTRPLRRLGMGRADRPAWQPGQHPDRAAGPGAAFSPPC